MCDRKSGSGRSGHFFSDPVPAGVNPPKGCGGRGVVTGTPQDFSEFL